MIAEGKSLRLRELPRVLITTDTVGGVWDYTTTLAGELTSAGHDVMVAVIGDSTDDRVSALPDGVESVTGDYLLEWRPEGTKDIRPASAWLGDVADEWGADIVHLNQLSYASGIRQPTVVVAHSDALSWWSEVRGERVPAEWDGYREAVERGLAAANVVVTPTQYQADLLRTHYGTGADRVIWNGRAYPRDTERSPSGGPLVVTVGRMWDPGKGAGVLDEALEILGDDAPPAHAIGATTGPEGDRFTASRLIPEGRVSSAEVDRWLRRAEIYVGASLYEPFGLAPLEAAQRGCVLVLSDIGSFRELWDDCALFFDPGDSAALAATLRTLMDDAGARHALAARATERARQQFGVERMVNEYRSLYSAMPRTRISACA